MLLQRFAQAGEPPPGPGPVPPRKDPGHDRLPLPDAFDDSRSTGQLLPDGRLLVKLPKALQQRVRRATGGWDYDVMPAPSGPTEPGLVYQRDAPASPKNSSAPPEATIAPATSTPPGSGPAESRPETVRIPGLGQYEIDIQRLLDRSPVVVQKDGSYVIHLPSLFEMGPAKKK